MTANIVQSNLIQKAWQDPAFKNLLLTDPKAAIKEVLGIVLPDHVQVKTLEEKPDQYYLVLPANPSDAMAINKSEPLSMW